MKPAVTTILLSLFFCSTYWGQVPMATLLGHWSDTTLEGSGLYDNTYNEVWSYAQNGHEYAIIGSTFGTHIINVDDPSSPSEEFRFEGTVSGPQIIHRDYHDYRGYLYCVSDEGFQNKLQIIDLNSLPDTAFIVYESNDVLGLAHNIFVDSSRAHLYALIARDGVSNYDAMRIYDIEDPINPQFLRAYNSIQGFSFSQVHDAYVDRDTAFLNLGPSGFLIVDFTDLDSPEVLSGLAPFDYPQSGYNHSGWVTEDKQYYYMADENHDLDLKVVDIRDIQNVEVINTFNADADHNFSIPHNQIVHCVFLYVSYYFDGLQVYDLSDPETPQRIMHYPTSTENPIPNYKGAWGVTPFLPSGLVLVSDMQNGLFILESPQDHCSNVVNTDRDRENSNSLTVYPNPSPGDLMVDIVRAGYEQIEVYSSLGELMKAIPINEQDILLSLHGLPKGMYHLLVRSDTKENLVTKFILK